MPSVLMIDDSKTVIEAVSRFLSVHGYRVIAAGTFIDIPKLIEREKPCAVILDLNMPALSGEQIAKFLRRYDCRSPIVIFSGEDPQELERMRSEIGASFCVSKGRNMTDLLVAIQSCAQMEVS